jgi:hypothetical protein
MIVSANRRDEHRGHALAAFFMRWWDDEVTQTDDERDSRAIDSTAEVRATRELE